jgi:rare lipoprotein A
MLCEQTKKHSLVKLFWTSIHRITMRIALLVLSFTLILTSSCSRSKKSTRVPQSPTRTSTVNIGDTERGIASWYGDPYHGRRAANGEVFDMNQMTAAHRTMPFGTWLEVTNENNGQQVNVRITDRGPFVNNRIIDLSRAAAQKISLIGPGTVPVKLLVIAPPRGEVVELYGVQVAASEDRAKAQRLQTDLERSRYKVRLVTVNQQPLLYRVIVGEGTREQAEQLRRQLSSEGHRGFVTRHVP